MLVGPAKAWVDFKREFFFWGQVLKNENSKMEDPMKSYIINMYV